MKKPLLVTLLLLTPTWADTVYRSLPDPSCRIVQLGSRWVVQDHQGFFMGYYQPAPPPNTYVPPPKPVRQPRLSDSGSTFGFSFGSSPYSSGFYAYPGGFSSPYGYAPYASPYRGHCGSVPPYTACPPQQPGGSPCHQPTPAPRAPEPIRVGIPIH